MIKYPMNTIPASRRNSFRACDLYIEKEILWESIYYCCYRLRLLDSIYLIPKWARRTQMILGLTLIRSFLRHWLLCNGWAISTLSLFGIPGLMLRHGGLSIDLNILACESPRLLTRWSVDCNMILMHQSFAEYTSICSIITTYRRVSTTG